MFIPCVEALPQTGLIPGADSDRKLRVVFEKPFGHHLASAQELSHSLSRVLTEDQIYRIDHYLGKETVQNILITSDKMSNDDAYSIVKLIFDKKQDLVAVHKEAQNIDLKYQRTANSPVPWHPGAVKYFTEKGIKM